jgi:hypothetical protein
VQVAKKSWYPLPATWDAAGCNWGYWTDWNEVWYQKHIKSIQDGKFEPLPANKWFDKLKIWRLSKVLVENYEKLSQKFLDRQC